MFKSRHFDREIIILCVRWYVTYKLSYRDLAAMMLERGISVAPSTIFRWVQRYEPQFEKRWDRFSRPVGRSWRVDETYILVKGPWGYLYRAVDKQGRTVALRQDRGIAAAQAFFRKAFSSHPNRPPRKVTLDGHRPSHRALRLLRRERPASRRERERTGQVLRLGAAGEPRPGIYHHRAAAAEAGAADEAPVRACFTADSAAHQKNPALDVARARSAIMTARAQPPVAFVCSRLTARPGAIDVAERQV